MELGNRIELGTSRKKAWVEGGRQPVSEEDKPAIQAPRTSAPAESWAAP